MRQGRNRKLGQVWNTGQRLIAIIQITPKNTAEKTLVQTNQMIGWRAQVSCTARSSFLAPQHLGNLAGTANFNKPSADPVFGPFKSDQSSFCADRWSRPWHSLGAWVEIRKQWQYFFYLLFSRAAVEKGKTNGIINCVTGLGKFRFKKMTAPDFFFVITEYRNTTPPQQKVLSQSPVL